MKANWPPFEEFIDHILNENSYPGLAAFQDIDSTSYDEVPFVSWTVIVQGQKAHGLWDVVLAFTVMCETKDADKILSHLYAQIHGWESLDKGELTSKRIGVESVRDVAGFDRIHAVFMNGRHVSQFTAQFGLTINDFS